VIGAVGMAEQAIRRTAASIRSFLGALGVVASLAMGLEALAAPLNLAPDGDAFLGAGANITGTSDVTIVSSGLIGSINDQVVAPTGPFNIRAGQSVDTFTGDTANNSRLFDFVGILFDSPQNSVTSVRVQNFAASDGGWWGVADTSPHDGVPLAAGELLAPDVQVTSNGGATWTTVASMSDYVTAYTGVIRGNGVPNAGAGPLATFNFASQSGINGIRLIGEGGGNAGTGPGFIGLIEMEVLQDAGVVFPSLDINTTTGAMTLNTGAGTARAVQGYSITSSDQVGALKPSAWLSVADNYDLGHPGVSQVDANDQWTELTLASSRTDLSESQFGGDGGLLSGNRALPLGNAWIRNPFGEDVRMEVQLADGRVRKVNVTYNGGAENPLIFGDFNFDGQISGLDWPTVRDNFGATLAGLSKAELYSFGDLNGDGTNNEFDFSQFKNLYDETHGAGAFTAMLSGVPEPGSMVLVLVAATFVAAMRRRPAIGR
jgi:hypothetical protein